MGLGVDLCLSHSETLFCEGILSWFVFGGVSSSVIPTCRRLARRATLRRLFEFPDVEDQGQYFAVIVLNHGCMEDYLNEKS